MDKSRKITNVSMDKGECAVKLLQMCRVTEVTYKVRATGIFFF